MVDCKKCIHQEVCYLDIQFEGAEYCDDFKDKTRFIEVPCKINDTVYGIKKYKGIWNVKKGIVSEMFFTRDMDLVIVVHHILRGRWGRTIFPTEEAAQQALQTLREGTDNGNNDTKP